MDDTLHVRKGTGSLGCDLIVAAIRCYCDNCDKSLKNKHLQVHVMIVMPSLLPSENRDVACFRGFGIAEVSQGGVNTTGPIGVRQV